MRLGVFDVVGVVAVAVFASLLGADLPGLRSPAREIDLDPKGLAAGQGFRAGVSWFGLYLDDVKVGCARVSRQVVSDGYSFHYDAVADVEVLGSGQRFEVGLEASLDRAFRLKQFDLALTSSVLDVSATGTVGDREIEVAVTVGDLEDKQTVAFESRPFLDIGVFAMVLSRRPAVGERIEIEVFDPLGLELSTMTVTYLGIEQIAVVDGPVSAHRLRRSMSGANLDVWVNDLGEVFKEELPLGVFAIRETEAAATWGFRRPAKARGGFLTLPPSMENVLEREARDRPAAP